jgi:hypoxanthine phosphoribosyltransferase
MSTRKIILSKAQLQKRVSELGAQISRDYSGKSLVLIGVLNGAFIFMADLARAIELEHVQVDFIRVSSYGKSSESSGEITLSKDVELDLEDKDVLLVEDIIDTGRTLAWLHHSFQQRKAASVRICTLIDKSERREVDIQPDYTGFAVAEGFLVGYGLDYAEDFRHFPEISHLELS